MLTTASTSTEAAFVRWRNGVDDWRQPLTGDVEQRGRSSSGSSSEDNPSPPALITRHRGAKRQSSRQAISRPSRPARRKAPPPRSKLLQPHLMCHLMSSWDDFWARWPLVGIAASDTNDQLCTRPIVWPDEAGASRAPNRLRLGAMAGKKLSAKLQDWVKARERHRLSHAHVQMARELGMNPRKLGKLDNHDQEPWKAPLPRFIEHLYFRNFGRERPEVITSIKERRPCSMQRRRRARRRGARQNGQKRTIGLKEEGNERIPVLRVPGDRPSVDDT